MNRYVNKVLNLTYTQLSSSYNRNFCLHSRRFNKLFKDIENTYAYDLMSHKGYLIKDRAYDINILYNKDIIQSIQRNWYKETPSNLYKIFSEVCLYCSTNNFCISNQIFDDFIDSLTDSIQFFSDEEIKSMFYLLKTLPETASIKTRNYIELWAALDDACLKRRIEWSFDEQLNIISLMYALHILRVTEFPYKCILRMSNKAKQLTPSQLVQTLFYIGVLRKPPDDMHNLEIHLENNLSQFNVDDLAIMSLGFFKSQTPIRNFDLISKICDKVIENCNTINEIALAALLKNIRYSIRVSKNDCIYRLLDTLQYQIHRLSIKCCVHIALLGTTSLTLHKKCLNEIANYVVDKLPNARIKDLERLTFTFGTFNVIPETTKPFFKHLLIELKKPERNDEFIRYGRSFACCVAYMSLLGIYSTELTDKILDHEFLNQTYGKYVYSYGREVLVLHNIAEIYFKDIKINSLPKKSVTILAKKYTDYVPDVNYNKQYNVSEKMMIDVMMTLRKSRGEDCVIGDHILSHHQRGDIILCNDHNGIPLKLKDIQKSFKFGSIIRPPDSNVWIVLVIAGRNVMINNSNISSGPLTAKMRELKEIGYYPAMVGWNVWMKLQSPEERLSYLNSLINDAIK